MGIDEESAKPTLTAQERLSPKDYLAQTLRIPAAAREAAMTYRGTPSSFAFDPAWKVLPEDEEYVRKLIPKTEPVRPRNTAPRVAPLGEVAQPDLATALMHSMPRLTALTKCAKRAGELVDEIAYMVQTKGLGKGDVAGGVRAAISLISTGRWKRPLGFDTHWRGAVFRGFQTHKEEGIARKNVH